MDCVLKKKKLCLFLFLIVMRQVVCGTFYCLKHFIREYDLEIFEVQEINVIARLVFSNGRKTPKFVKAQKSLLFLSKLQNKKLHN